MCVRYYHVFRYYRLYFGDAREQHAHTPTNQRQSYSFFFNYANKKNIFWHFFNIFVSYTCSQLIPPTIHPPQNPATSANGKC